jgi:hypothetical protein
MINDRAEIGEIARGGTELLGENLLQYHFVHHKPHITCQWTQTTAVGNRPATHLSYGTVQLCFEKTQDYDQYALWAIFFLIYAVRHWVLRHYWPIVPAPDDR